MIITPRDATLGATVEGVSLARLDDAEWAQVLDAFHTHAVLCFPGQHLTNQEHVDFSLRWGSLESVGRDNPGARPEISRISNLRSDGTTNSDADSPAMRVMIGNMQWHTDSSFRVPPAKASILACEVTPPSGGGETEFADMRAAYDALDEASRSDLEGRLVTHSYLFSQGKVGGLDSNFTAEQRRNMGPTDHPIARVHEVTGRRSLFIGRHACALSGYADEVAQAKLQALLEWAVQPPRVFTHRWQPGDVVMWDNRCVLHRARPWNYHEPRLMWHTRVAGTAA